MTRRLRLSREALAELTTGELVRVVGGATLQRTCPLNECLFPESRITCLDCYETRPCTG